MSRSEVINSYASLEGNAVLTTDLVGKSNVFNAEVFSSDKENGSIVVKAQELIASTWTDIAGATATVVALGRAIVSATATTGSSVRFVATGEGTVQLTLPMSGNEQLDAQ